MSEEVTDFNETPSYVSRLALGTVQMGLNYGIANTTGQMATVEARQVLDLAKRSGINTLDTAIAYGDSERLLGEIGVAQWDVITKLPAMPELECDVAAWVRSQVLTSLKRLGIAKVHGVLMHRSRDLLRPVGDAIIGELVRLQNEGYIRKIGISIYSPTELNDIVGLYPIEIIQAPFNVFDQQLLTTGWLARLNDIGIEVHARSVFLQGLLLLGSTKRPAQFDRWQSLWHRWDAWLAEKDMTALQACLSCALSHSGIQRVVVGVDGLGQLQGILAEARSLVLRPHPMSLACDDELLINPANWGRL